MSEKREMRPEDYVHGDWRLHRTAKLNHPAFARKHFERAAEPVVAIPTPLPKWNRRCRDEGGGKGLAPGWHITIGGNTGTGKSLMALNLGAHALKAGWGVCYVNLEMSTTQIATRLYAILTGEKVKHLEPGTSFDPEAASRVIDALKRDVPHDHVRFVCNDAPLRQVEDVLGFMEGQMEEHEATVVVVDYMQLVSSGYESMIREITDISMRISGFAKRHKVVTVGLSQLNRHASKNYEDPPTPQSLMGGSPLENDSDQVLLLDHSDYERKQVMGPTGSPKTVATTKLILGKNRHGGQGPIPIQWDYDDLTVHERED